jgi:hypothetical protein
MTDAENIVIDMPDRGTSCCCTYACDDAFYNCTDKVCCFESCDRVADRVHRKVGEVCYFLLFLALIIVIVITLACGFVGILHLSGVN